LAGQGATSLALTFAICQLFPHVLPVNLLFMSIYLCALQGNDTTEIFFEDTLSISLKEFGLFSTSAFGEDPQ